MLKLTIEEDGVAVTTCANGEYYEENANHHLVASLVARAAILFLANDGNDICLFRDEVRHQIDTWLIEHGYGDEIPGSPSFPGSFAEARDAPEGPTVPGNTCHGITVGDESGEKKKFRVREYVKPDPITIDTPHEENRFVVLQYESGTVPESEDCRNHWDIATVPHNQLAVYHKLVDAEKMAKLFDDRCDADSGTHTTVELWSADQISLYSEEGEVPEFGEVCHAFYRDLVRGPDTMVEVTAALKFLGRCVKSVSIKSKKGE